MKYLCALTIVLFSSTVEGAATHCYLMPHPKAQQLYLTPLDLSTCSPEQCDDILAVAAQIGDLPKVDAVIKAGADPIGHPDDIAPLMRAVCGGHHEVVQHLVRCGAQVNRLDVRLGFSPLHLAIRRGHLAIIQTFVANGADVSVQTTACLDAHDVALMWHVDDAPTLVAIFALLDKKK